MGNNYFHFKRFTVHQEGAAMKVGTDGVLIGAWARVGPEQGRLLDIGTGTGLIALMLAQRAEGWDARIDAVEIEPDSFRQARENISASAWSECISVYENSVQDFAAGLNRSGTPHYDHIVSNPPYFVDSLLPPAEGRALARHTSSLTYEELCESVSRLLAPDGIFSVIIPFENADEFTRTAEACGLFPSRKCVIYGVAGALPKRVMLEFSRKKGIPELSELAIESGDPRDFSPEYRALTCDFYLKF